MTPTHGAPTSIPAYQQTGTGTGRGTASLVLGICSVLAGWFVLAPVIGLYLGVSSRRREPLAQGRALWGIILNGAMLLIWVVLIAVVVAVAGMGGIAAIVNGS